MTNEELERAVERLEGRCKAIDAHYAKYPNPLDRTMEDTAKAIRTVLEALSGRTSPSAGTKRSEPDALPGDLRERVARRAAAAILEQDGYSAVGPYLNADLTLDYLDQGEVDFGKVADAILSLIQSERGGA